MIDLSAFWPQNRIDFDCFVTIGMDISAPLLSDMGLQAAGIEPLRATFREKIDENPEILAIGVASGADKVRWLEQLDDLLQKNVAGATRQHFYEWVRDTYTLVPADRPNWERYETFFFQWSVGMRTGEDRARCFAEPARVYEAYYAFIASRKLKQRIQDASRRSLSPWDEKMFYLRRYSLVEEEMDSAEFLDPFGAAHPTSNRNYFQQFWEYLAPRLSGEERKRLYDSIWEYYGRTSFMLDLVPPDQLTRGTR